MMELLGGLARNLIIVVFVHTLLEMLSPQGQFHRYIRLVTGLIVILMVVSAISALLGRLPAESAAAVPGPDPGTEAGEQAARLWRLNRERSLSVYREALHEVVREEIEASGQWVVVETRFVLEEDPYAEQFGVIRRMEVRVREAGNGAGAIEPVRIEPMSPEPEPGAGGQAEPADPIDPAARPRLADLEQALVRRLQLDPVLITVSR